MSPRLVCRTGPAGEVEAYLTNVCMPDGFGVGEPQPQLDATGTPPRCD